MNGSNYGPTSETDKARVGFFRAGQVAMWVWVVLALVPILAILACCGLCSFGGAIGAVTTPEPTSSPW